MKTIQVELTGVSALLMHSDRSLDPLDPLVREAGAITSKGAKKRTDVDNARLLEIKFHLALYHDGEKPYVPERCVLGALRDGARRNRQGKEVMAGVVIDPDNIPLIYDGPKNPDKLYLSTAFRDIRSVVIGKARVVQCRPRFIQWKLPFRLIFDSTVINERTLKAALDAAGMYVGMCDFRPRFGRFEVTSWTA